MRIDILCLALVSCALASACTSVERKPDPFSPKISCNGHECAATVTVSTIGSTCKPNAILDIDLRTGEGGNKNITWTIGTEGYEFSRESYKFALFIKDDPGSEFKDVMVQGNGKTLTIKYNGLSSGRDYGYAITVRRSNGQFCETLDPWLIS